MTGALTLYGAQQLMGGGSMPSTWYAKGHLSNPGSSAALNAAMETRRLQFSVDAAVAGITQNSERRVLNNAATTEDWYYLSLWDAYTGGNAWWVIELSAPLSVVTGNAVIIPDAALSFGLEVWS